MIPDEHIELLNGDRECDTAALAAIASSYPAFAWIVAINEKRLSVAGKLNLVEACQDREEMIPVLVRLASQYGFGLSIAGEITAESNWKVLSALLEKHKFPQAASINDKQRAIASLMVDGAVFKYVFGLLFSKNVVGALMSLIVDREYELRMKALTRLSRHNGDEVKESLITALEDSHESVRKNAKQILYIKYPKEVGDEIFKEQEADRSKLRKSANDAYELLRSVMTSLPGVSTVSRAATAVSNSVASATSTARVSLLRGFGELFKKDDAQSDQKNAFFALQLAMVWADGILDDKERELMKALAGEYAIDKTLLNYVDQCPTMSDLAPYLRQLKTPEQHLRNALHEQPTDPTMFNTPYYESLGMLLGVKLDTLVGALS